MFRDLDIIVVFTAGMQVEEGQQPARGEPSSQGGACSPVAQPLGPARTLPGIPLLCRGLAQLLRPVPCSCARPPPWTSVNHLTSDGAEAALCLPGSPPPRVLLLVHLPWSREFPSLRASAERNTNFWLLKCFPGIWPAFSPSCFPVRSRLTFFSSPALEVGSVEVLHLHILTS